MIRRMVASKEIAYLGVEPVRRRRHCAFYSFLLIGAFCLYLFISAMFFFQRSCPSIDFDEDLSTRVLKEPKSVAVLITATGMYFPLGVKLVESGFEFFCTSGCSNVTYFLFTDARTDSGNVNFSNQHIKATTAHNMIVVPIPKAGPNDRMKKFHNYLKQHHTLKNYDFVISLDANLRFVSNVSIAELYSDMFGILHPGFLTTNRWSLPFERGESRSRAFVSKLTLDACHYFTGAIWGGSSSSFIRALRTLIWQIDWDSLEIGPTFNAVWRDESHLNRYFVDFPPSRILSPSYFFPEDSIRHGAMKSYQKKIIALSQHSIRSELNAM